MTANDTPTGRMTPPGGARKRKRLVQPLGLSMTRNEPGARAAALAAAHNDAVRSYGSDSGGFHTFDPATNTSAGVWDGTGGFPDKSVVSHLSWGTIDARLAQWLLESDAIFDEQNEG